MKIIETPYGICHLSVVPVRLEPFEGSQMLTQLLFGELLQVIEKQPHQSLVRILFDNTEGWISNNQFLEISDREYRQTLKKKPKFAHKWITKLRLKNTSDELFLHIPKGATFTHNHLLKTSQATQRLPHNSLISTALEYLNVPFLAGGRTPFGIDASGFTQIVYKLHHINLLRKVEDQATQGQLISFLDETKPGDLAFFDDENGKIIHTGILLGDNKIIHAHGKIRIDRIDHIGIFNNELRNYTHKLRLLRTHF